MKKILMETVLSIQHSILGHCAHQVTVRKIGKGWNIRVFTNGNLNQELRVYKKEHIRHAVAEILRWEDKCGNWSNMATASRARYNRKFGFN